MLLKPAPSARRTTDPTSASTSNGRRGMLRVASPASHRGSAPVLRQRGRELRGACRVDVHRPHRQRDREHRRRVAARTPEADGDEVGERNLRAAAGGDGDRGHREPDVQRGDDAEGERNRAREVALGAAELASELRHRLPADEEPDQDARRVAHGPPAVRRERRPVVTAARGNRDPDRARDHDDEDSRQAELEARRDPQPERVGGENGAEHQEPDDDGHARAGAGQVRDVVAADQGDRGTADENRAS